MSRLDVGVERAVKLSFDQWGRIVALLAARDGDLAGAEDAVATAIERAIHTWDVRGIPENPSGWIYRVALNVRRDVWKSAARRTSVPLASTHHEAATDGGAEIDVLTLPDYRLQMLAACVHPDIAPSTRPLLMLSAVMGLSAKSIAEAMVLSAPTVAARITRAKSKVAVEGIALRPVDRDTLSECLPDILEAIYATFTSEWAHAHSDVREGMIGEALFLAELVATLCPERGETHGLAALLQLSAARFPARRTAAGEFIRLEKQDPHCWLQPRVSAGEWHLRQALQCREIGRFSLEAVIQALHMQGVRTGRPDWNALYCQHDHLVRIAPTVGARVSRAAILSHINGPHVALRELDRFCRQTTTYAPAWVLKGNLLVDLNRVDEARNAFTRALALATNSSERDYLQQQLDRL